MAKKERLDVLLVNRGLIDTREKAKRAIMAGLVYTDSERLDKPGVKVNDDIVLHVKGDTLRYVGRGGLKLEKAIETFGLKLTDKVVLDIGSSTGGFTDCALQNGASTVYALDVGYNQLAWKLRVDDRVVVMERTNFRYCTQDDFQNGLPDLATIDVSFISLKIILPVLKSIFETSGEVIALVKPQFEAGRDDVGKKGIVRDKKVHERVLNNMITFALEVGYGVKGLSFSPITGGEGNIEFLLHLGWQQNQEAEGINVVEVVEQAHSQL
ncbi:TlyA family RNA methyltransferase [Guptibacillus algicola]|uniref:TlyA family RNA methyltransferase n=1 Tax=Guptibacillus algicola TaxID=225844 RepID=UPI001CD1AF1F|nr:TlyA family RNA methyltransferase [Alkalihalobacillus algicola]MCA0985965.1 TlyA family RNA methyltransferase [Alkalihalobacillus algicola]